MLLSVDYGRAEGLAKCKRMLNLCYKTHFFLEKIWWGTKKGVTLHSLSGTTRTAAKRDGSEMIKKVKISLKILPV